MAREPHYVQVGGILFETDPTYTVKGDFGGTPVELEIFPEDQIADVGGLRIQTGTVYHVSGSIAGTPVKLDVSSEDHVSDIGGMKVLTGTTVHCKGDGHDLAVNRVSETRNVSDGLSIETASWWTASGKTPSGEIDLRLDGLRGSDRLAASGGAAREELALLVALRPFIAAS